VVVVELVVELVVVVPKMVVVVVVVVPKMVVVVVVVPKMVVVVVVVVVVPKVVVVVELLVLVVELVVVELEPVVLVVELVVVVVVLLVVVVVGPHAGSAGSVQEQIGGMILHWAITALLHVLRAMPDKPAHPASISSAQAFLVHTFCALATEGTKTPAPSATAANVTTALPIIVIVESPSGRSRVNSDFAALSVLGARSSTRLSREFLD
jgi:hypothetical protein